ARPQLRSLSPSPTLFRPGADERCGRRVRVGDEAHSVAQVQLPRPGRDVTGRVAEAEERAVARRDGLGDDGPVPFLVEAVRHDALEPRQLPHGTDGALEELLDRAGLLQ